jgi:hypothetical protein
MSARNPEVGHAAMWFFVGVGVAWPFILAALMLGATVGHWDSDRLAYGLLCGSVLGWPAVAVCVYHQLPAEWTRDRRVTVAGLLAFPAVAVEVVPAIGCLGIAWAALGFVPA